MGRFCEVGYGAGLEEVDQDVSRHPCIRGRTVRRHRKSGIEVETAPIAQHLIGVSGRVWPCMPRSLHGAYPARVACHVRADVCALERDIVSDQMVGWSSHLEEVDELLVITAGQTGIEIRRRQMVGVISIRLRGRSDGRLTGQ